MKLNENGLLREFELARLLVPDVILRFGFQFKFSLTLLTKLMTEQEFQSIFIVIHYTATEHASTITPELH